MIMPRWARAVSFLGASLLYWTMVSLWANVAEPWDAPGYWTVAYPLSVLLAAGAGWVSGRHGWLVGLMMSLAQLPVMAMQDGAGTSWAIALFFLLPLSMPHVAAALLAFRHRRRNRQA